MADRVPWPRKTGGTWGLTTHSTCSLPFLMHSRVFRSAIGAKHTRESCHRLALWKRRLTHVTSTSARPEDLTESSSPPKHALPCPATALLNSVAPPPVAPFGAPNTPCAAAACIAPTLCSACRFNDALAFWQLMGCVRTRPGPTAAADGPHPDRAGDRAGPRAVIGSPRRPDLPCRGRAGPLEPAAPRATRDAVP